MSSDDVGRNDPCPCGSGLKYKRCHLAIRETALREAVAIHDRDRDLCWVMNAWAEETLGVKPLPLDFDDPLIHFMLPLELFHGEFDGATIAQRFLAEHRAALDGEDIAWLEAQMASWLSIWEVGDVEPGVKMTMSDLLTGEKRVVHEYRASLECRRGANLLTRVVDFDGRSYMCGTHPVPLPPYLGDQACELIRRRLRVKRRTSPQRLRQMEPALIVADMWEEVVDALRQAFEDGPNLVTTEGDPILGVTDRYSIDEGMDAVVERIRRMPGTEMISDVLAILVRDDSIVANIDIEPKRLVVEAHSIARADSARAALELACGDGIRFQSRAILDPLSKKVQEEQMARPRQPRSADDLALARAYKERYYANWLDEPIPMLGDVTPREAIRSDEGRRQLDLLLRDMEFREQENDPAERFDVDLLRRELNLAE